MTTTKLVLTVTEEQLEVLQGLYTSFGWDLPEPQHETQNTEATDESAAEEIEEEEIEEEASCSSIVNEQTEIYYEDRNECTKCFIDPCITLPKPHWLGDGQAPHKNNSGLRKDRYKRYWKAIANCGGWKHPRYVQRKASAGPAGNSGTEVWNKREILPDCVVNQVRSLYPNPPGVPYMGHKWN